MRGAWWDTFLLENDADDQPVDTEDTRHNDGHDRPEDEVRSGDAHGADADSGLGGSVGGSKI